MSLLNSQSSEKNKDPDALYHLALLNLQQGLIKEGIRLLEQSIDCKSDQPKALCDLGTAYSIISEPEKALANFNRAIEIDPLYPHSFNNKGITLLRLNRLDEALTSLNQAIMLDPLFVEAYNTRGNTLVKLGKVERAIEDYDKALDIKANYIDALNNRAITFLELKKYELALQDFKKVINIDPDFFHALGHLMHVKMQLCDWQDFDSLKNEFIEKTNLNKNVCPPFVSLSLIDSPEIQFTSAKIYSRSLLNSSVNGVSFKKNQNDSKIRIGYFSADFHDHATMRLIAEVLELHDKNKFEVFGFSFGVNKEDHWSERARRSVNEFFDVKYKSDAEIAQLSRDMKIDIAVDLKGFTTDQRIGIFINRAAPIQISYLGYPGTMANYCIDYIIADKIVIPKKNSKFYSEKIIFLPNSYQPNIKHTRISNKDFVRSDFDLPDNSFVFCSFNNNYKITPTIFESWMNILRSTKDSVLWILLNNRNAAQNLKNEAKLHGVDPNRIIFASSMLNDDHLKRIQLADLFLDTFPYNAHTTASDALRVCLPVLTIEGESFPSRVASSLLSELCLTELISKSLSDYENIAIKIASNPEFFQKIKEKLTANLRITTLFNSKLYTKNLESAYTKIYQRFGENLHPDHVYV